MSNSAFVMLHLPPPVILSFSPRDSFFSKIITLLPRLAACPAAIIPAAPPPTMITSNSSRPILKEYHKNSDIMLSKSMERVATSDLLSLKGKVAIVTGGAMGIGFEIAKRLSEAEAVVVVADMNADAGQEAARQLQNANFVETNVTVQSDVDALIKHTLQEFEGVDILINNAGIFPFKPMLDMSIEEWQRI